MGIPEESRLGSQGSLRRDHESSVPMATVLKRCQKMKNKIARFGIVLLVAATALPVMAKSKKPKALGQVGVRVRSWVRSGSGFKY